MKKKGRDKFVNLLDGMIKQRQRRGTEPAVELGTYYKEGILPDSYPAGSEPDEDFYLCQTGPLREGDRVLILWADSGELIAIGKLEGGEDDDGSIIAGRVDE